MTKTGKVLTNVLLLGAVGLFAFISFMSAFCGMVGDERYITTACYAYMKTYLITAILHVVLMLFLFSDIKLVVSNEEESNLNSGKSFGYKLRLFTLFVIVADLVYYGIFPMV